MAEEGNSAKTKLVGYVDMAKVKTLKGWDEYQKAAKALSEAREKAQEAKEGIRSQLQKLKPDADIDFTVEAKRIRVFENLQASKRQAATDLSDKL